jgi:hypothetical protein
MTERNRVRSEYRQGLTRRGFMGRSLSALIGLGGVSLTTPALVGACLDAGINYTPVENASRNARRVYRSTPSCATTITFLPRRGRKKQ